MKHFYTHFLPKVSMVTCLFLWCLSTVAQKYPYTNGGIAWLNLSNGVVPAGLTVTNVSAGVFSNGFTPWPDCTTNQILKLDAEKFALTNGVVAGKSCDSEIPVGSFWASATFLDSESKTVPHFMGLAKIVGVGSNWVWTISTTCFPSVGGEGTGAYYYFTRRTDFISSNQRIYPTVYHY